MSNDFSASDISVCTLAGEWHSLDEFEDFEAFSEAFRGRIEDMEYVPGFIGKDDLEDIWDYYETCNALERRGSVPLQAYLEWVYELRGSVEPVRVAEDYYYGGPYYSDKEFGIEYAENSGILDGIPNEVAMYFNYEDFGRDLLINDFDRTSSGYVFRN